jgi:CubicO group peptidase (beta-lactamase class C family)
MRNLAEARLAPDQAAAIRSAYAGLLLPEDQVRLFRTTDRLFPSRVIARGPRVRELPAAPRSLEGLRIASNGQSYDYYDYVSRNRVAGLLVLQRGRLAVERFELGNGPESRWVSMSVAKSISTTLVGVAIRDGYITGVDAPLTEYLPALRGTSYEGTSVRELLQMTSGVRWDDTHTDPASDRRRMLELQIEQEPAAILRYVASRPRVAPPGTLWNYSTGETHVVGALLHAATGRWLSDYLSERIWAPYGMEADATWWLESAGGLEIAGAGISATLRDYARFGLFMQGGGTIDDRPVLPDGWVAEATSPHPLNGSRLDYGYMWWPVPSPAGSFADRAFSARGIFGQYLYVNPAAEIVIAVVCARSKPKGAEVVVDNDFFNAVVEHLR